MVNNNIKLKEIYLAGGCFGEQKNIFLWCLASLKPRWGTQTEYQNPTYEDVCYKDTGHAETVKMRYNTDEIRLEFILELFYDVIDPTSVNRQGNDIGTQYRTGIYYVDEDDKAIILNSVKELQKSYTKPITIEVMPLQNYYAAEDYHQKYLDKNPDGYCHIDRSKFEKARKAWEDHYEI